MSYKEGRDWDYKFNFFLRRDETNHSTPCCRMSWEGKMMAPHSTEGGLYLSERMLADQAAASPAGSHPGSSAPELQQAPGRLLRPPHALGHQTADPRDSSPESQSSSKLHYTLKLLCSINAKQSSYGPQGMQQQSWLLLRSQALQGQRGQSVQALTHEGLMIHLLFEMYVCKGV